MHNVILLSSDARQSSRCSSVLAQQLLQHGLAKITKFYPYTVQFKSGKPFDPNAFTNEIIAPAKGPSNHSSSLKKSLKREVSYE